MSFSNDVKKELLSTFPDDDNSARASLASIINSVGSIIVSREGTTFSVVSENVEVIEYTKRLINKLYSRKIDVLRLVSTKKGRNEKNEFLVPAEIGREILFDLAIITVDERNNRVINKVIDHHLIIEDASKIAYLKAGFLACGSVSISLGSDSAKKNSGYHLEMLTSSQKQATLLTQLMGEFGIISKKIERGDNFLVYLKEGDAISDFFALIGASKSVIALQQEMVKREMRNNINRGTNCISANIDKSINASLAQLHAIELIDSTMGIENLPKGLLEIALLRRDNPEASLIELASLSSDKITKAGVSYKLKKIIEIANNL